MPNITHVIFDLDGVLLDTEPISDELCRAYAVEKGVPPKIIEDTLPKLWLKMRGRRKDENAKTLLTGLRIYTGPEDSPEFQQAIQDWFTWREPTLIKLLLKAHPMPGAVQLVEHLEKHNIPIAVATSTDERLWKVKSQNHPWLRSVQTVVTGNEVVHGKPHPETFLAAIQRLRADPASCLIFEDAAPGVEAGLAAGTTVIFVNPVEMHPNELQHILKVYPHAKERIQRLHSLEDFKPEEWGLPTFKK